METIIKTIQEKIKSLSWDIDYHDNALSAAIQQKSQLEKELEQLKDKQYILVTEEHY